MVVEGKKLSAFVIVIRRPMKVAVDGRITVQMFCDPWKPVGREIDSLEAS